MKKSKIIGMLIAVTMVGTVTASAKQPTFSQAQEKAISDIVQSYESYAVANGGFPKRFNAENLITEGFLEGDSHAKKRAFIYDTSTETGNQIFDSEDAAEESTINTKKEKREEDAKLNSQKFPIKIMFCQDRIAVFSVSKKLKTSEESVEWWKKNDCPQGDEFNYFQLSTDGLLILNMDEFMGEIEDDGMLVNEGVAEDEVGILDNDEIIDPEADAIALEDEESDEVVDEVILSDVGTEPKDTDEVVAQEDTSNDVSVGSGVTVESAVEDTDESEEIAEESAEEEIPLTSEITPIITNEESSVTEKDSASETDEEGAGVMEDENDLAMNSKTDNEVEKEIQEDQGSQEVQEDDQIETSEEHQGV